jgi:hypothetical protein
MKIFRLVVAIALFFGAIAVLEFMPVENDLLPAVEILCLAGGLVALPMRWRDSDFEASGRGFGRRGLRRPRSRGSAPGASGEF